MTFWDTQATRWGVFSVPDEDYDKYTARQTAFIVEQLAIDKGLVLDVGCGIGRLTFEVGTHCPDLDVLGVDTSPDMIEVALDQQRTTLPVLSPAFVYVDDLSALLAPIYAGAWCVLVFQHLGEAPIREILRTVAGALRPGGVFVTQWMLDKDQAFPSRADVLRVLEEEGFETVRYVDDSAVTRLWFADNWLWVTSERAL